MLAVFRIVLIIGIIMLQLQKCIVRCIDDTNAVYPDCICDRMLIDRAMPAVNYGKGCMQTFS